MYEDNGFEGLLVEMKNQEMELVLLDSRIPGGQNAEMLPVIRGIQTDVPILVFSGRDEWTHAPFYLNKSTDGFESKQANEISMALTFVRNG